MAAPHDLSNLDPTGRFTGLAQTYAKFRPSYPVHAIDFIMARCELTTESLVVDVGCGTGIGSRLVAARGVSVIGIEPNMEMRRAAAETIDPRATEPRLTYREGRAESTGLEPGMADAVLSAQAFHWFEPVATLREFHRILKPDRRVILMWNERDEHDPVTAAYGAVIRTARDSAIIENPRQTRAGEALRTSPLYRAVERITFPNQQVLDEEGLLGRAFSNSYAPRQPDERSTWAERLRAIFERYEQEGTITLRYQTTIYAAQRT